MKKKIIFVASFADSLINFRLQLMQSFIAKKYEVIALAPFDSNVKNLLQHYNIRFISIPIKRNGLNPLNDLKLFFTLRKIFNLEKPAIVFSYTIKPVIYASIAARAAKVPKIYSLITGTGYAFSKENVKDKIIGLIAQYLLKFALYQNSKIFFQNSDDLNLYRNKHLLSKNQLTTIINGSGVDCSKFYPVPLPKELSFLMIARLLYPKGVCEYVAAAKMLKMNYPHVKCRLVGWIDTNPQSIKQAQLDEWVRDGCIEYLGKLSDVRNSIADNSVYVLPSWNEGTPRTVLEAMAMARPIITTNTAGCKETVIPNLNGLLVPLKDVPALYNAMEYFIHHPEQIDSMGTASRHLALEKYEVNKVNHSILYAMGVD